MVLVIDNYDSFTYNLVQYLGELNVDLQVRRNDQITVDEIRSIKPERILVSPVPAHHVNRGFPMRSSKPLDRNFPSLAFASATNASAILLARTWW